MIFSLINSFQNLSIFPTWHCRGIWLEMAACIKAIERSLSVRFSRRRLHRRCSSSSALRDSLGFYPVKVRRLTCT